MKLKLKSVALTGSILLHAGLIAVIFVMPKTSKPVKLHPQYVTVVRLRPMPANEKASTIQSTVEPTLNQAGEVSSNKKKSLKYRDLLTLPRLSSNGLPIPSATAGKNAYEGESLGELLAQTSELRAHFDLPLIFRRQISRGHAWANLVLRGDSIEIEYLGGDREMRAAMFDSLKAQASYQALMESFRFFKSKRIKISIQYETYFVPQAQSEFETERKVYDNELEITWKRYTQSPKYGIRGSAIEDKHSLRAKKRDKRHWSRLINSSAYKKPIRKFRLTAPTKK